MRGKKTSCFLIRRYPDYSNYGIFLVDADKKHLLDELCNYLCEVAKINAERKSRGGFELININFQAGLDFNRLLNVINQYEDSIEKTRKLPLKFNESIQLIASTGSIIEYQLLHGDLCNTCAYPRNFHGKSIKSHVIIEKSPISHIRAMSPYFASGRDNFSIASRKDTRDQ